MLFILPLLFLLSVFSSKSAAQSTDGTIVLPTNGSAIYPGQSFAFEYDSMADYGVSARNYLVMLMTSPDVSVMSGSAEGTILGVFAEPNYPGNPNPPNPPPSELVTPDFSKNFGFGAGENASDVPVQLVIVEEYEIGTSLGFRLHSTFVNLIYNATTS